MQSLVLCFDQFELDLNSYELRRSGAVIKLEKLPTELLILLAERQGEVVSREQIIQRLWGDNVFVDTRQGINTAMRKIRLALQEDPDHPRMLQTVTGRGYRLLAPVVAVEQMAREPARPRAAVPQSLASDSVLAHTSAAKGWGWLLGVGLGLAALTWASVWTAHRETEPSAVVEQRITSNSPELPVRAAVVSPDGKYVAYAVPDGLYLRQMSTGETRPWPLPRGFEAWPSGWFPDSVHLLVTRFEGSERVRSLWTVSLLGGEPRKIMDNAAGGAVSPDGSQIAYLPGPEFGSELWLMDPQGANSRRIAVPERADQLYARGSWITTVAWSPGGKRLAYVECHGTTAPDPAEDSFSLRTRAASGGDLQVLLSGPDLGQALSWGADGRVLYAQRHDPLRESMDQDVHSVPANEESGRATGTARLVTSGQGRIGGLSSTRDGKQFVLWRVNSQFQAFLAAFDPASRRFQSLRRLTLDASGNLAATWTPDSKGFLFVSNRNGTWRLFKQYIGETTAEELVGGRSLYLPRLSPDGDAVLYLAASLPDDGTHPVAVMSRPIAGGAPRVVLRESGVANVQCAVAPSQLCLLSKIVKGEHIFLAFDTRSGEEREVTRVGGGLRNWNWALSPDGQTLALFLDRRVVRFLSLQTGIAHDVTIEKWPIFNGDWASDGRGLLMPSATPEGKTVILEVSPAGKARVVLEGEGSRRFDWLLQSRDGHYGLLEEQVPGENNVWMGELAGAR